MRKLGLGLVLGLVALGIVAAAATASPPLRIDDFELSVPDNTCEGDPDLTFTLKGSIVVHTLTPTEELQTFPNFTISWTAENGRTITSRGPASVRITYSDAAHTSVVRTEVRGLLVAVSFPGHGGLFVETGLLVVAGPFPGSPTILRHGPDGFDSEQERKIFCDYFTA